MKSAVVRQFSPTQIAIKTPFHNEFVDTLKDSIHWTSRDWKGKNVGWAIDVEFASQAIELAGQYFNVQDRRGKTAEEIRRLEAEAQDADIEDEIRTIRANQQYILEHEDDIEEIITALQEIIDSYSYASSSRVKAKLCKRQALFEHSLRNARTSINDLVEIQVRGLAAAVRLLKEKSVAWLSSK